MSLANEPHDNESRPNAGYKASRRGMIAAAVMFAAAVATTKAHAFSRAPRSRRRRNSDGGHCFVSGTRIRTPGGEVEIESLAVGDLVVTHDGSAKPVKWIGRRRLERGSAGRWRIGALPVKVCRSAFGPLVPHRDLYLSPTHAVYMDGLLVPVRNLVNGRSIVQCTAWEPEVIEYFHIELDGHDVIFAEGAPAETLLAAEDRLFDNWTGAAGVPAATVAEPYAPVVPFKYKHVIRSRLRSALSPLIDRRQPVDILWERIAERAETQLPA
jgi:hypothetical protein